ncbi:pilin [Undibacterium curvum]|jgi:type IV pilus assembly protein PilA|uniref:pilin n=1 Tax=Undibacterium curvum TaxID=2762294 RepID=UPI003D0CF295
MKKNAGFSLLELMAVVAIIAILGAMALPSYLYKVVREQVDSSVQLADIAKKPSELAWLSEKDFPADNAAAGLPTADKIVNNFISSVTVENGAIHIMFGNRASNAIKGRILSLRPAVVNDTHQVPVTWVCGKAEAPAKMSIYGTDKTSIPSEYLPAICRRKMP